MFDRLNLNWRQRLAMPAGLTAMAALAALLPLSMPMSVHAEVVDTTLDNGLRVIIKPDHRAPVVTSMVWYKVGSSYEHDGITGVSHVLEHMMFKGTERYPAGRFSSIISANGGSQNAFTSRDFTAYYQNLGSSRLAVSFELEADRMRGLTLGEEEFVKENKVVQEERRLRTDDKPQGLAAERFMATAFVNSGYHWPIIGWMNDLQQMTVADLAGWYQRWYAPNNATVVVVGDVDPDEVIALAKTHFGALTATGPTPAAPHRPEIKPLGERRIVVKAPARLPYLMMGYQVPVLTDDADSWEPYALEVLNWVLDGDDSSRLSRELVRGSEVAAAVSTGYDLYARNQTLFTLNAVPANGVSVAQLEQALKQQVTRMQQTLVSADELERVRNGAMAQEVFGRDSVSYQANLIGKLVTVGLDWRLADQYVERLQAVTPEQIQAVARKYLIDDRLTVATLRPQSIEDANQAAAANKESDHAG
jgi:zinc protease